jgi:VWFA-related protein
MPMNPRLSPFRQSVIAIVAMGAATAVAAAQRQVFRAVGSIVTVEVMVRDGNRLAKGLMPEDFEVYDNDVRQKVELLDVESLPIDLTLIVDTSGSVEPMIEELREYVRLSGEALRIDDRVRIVTFSAHVVDALPLQSPTTVLPVEKIVADGGTAIYDAIMSALMRTRVSDRRQILVCFTDGIETASAMNADAVLEVAKRSDSVLYVFLVKDVMMRDRAARRFDSRQYWLSRFEPNTAATGAERLSRVTAATGGALTEVAVRPQLPQRLRETLEDFRTSYVLRYRPTGVEPSSWHSIAVRVPKVRQSQVRARSGYFWGK